VRVGRQMGSGDEAPNGLGRATAPAGCGSLAIGTRAFEFANFQRCEVTIRLN